jgi:multidrug efflux pump subunit AcrA (membrane-fusion protein)
MKKSTVYLLPILVLAVGAFGMIAFLNMREDQPHRAPQAQARVVETRVVELGPVATDIKAFGTVVSTQPVDINAEVAGAILPGDIAFLPGQTFRAGDILVRIDDRQVQLDRQTTVSDLLTALANFLPEAKTAVPDEYGVWETYFNAVNFDSPLPDLPEAANQRIKLYLSRFSVYKYYFAIRNIEIRLEKHVIKALFDGAIVTADLRPGSTARAGTRLGSIVNLADLEVEVPLSAQDIPWLDFGRRVTFSSTEFDGSWQGEIMRTGQSIDPRTQTVPMFVALERDPSRVLPEGVFLGARVPGKLIDNAFEIPRRAIYDDQFVYLIRDGRFEYCQVQIARTLHETVVVEGGLRSGDTLVVEPLQGVVVGTPAEARTSNTTDGAE